MSPVYLMVREAILRKQVIVATYKGHKRLMCPHVIGRGKGGRPQALFYQFGGTSESGLGPPGSPQNWRCLPIDGLSEVSVTDGDWHTCTRHTREQTCVNVVDVEVSN